MGAKCSQPTHFLKVRLTRVKSTVVRTVSMIRDTQEFCTDWLKEFGNPILFGFGRSGMMCVEGGELFVK